MFLVASGEARWLVKAPRSGSESWFYETIGPHVRWIPTHTDVADPSVVLTEYLEGCPSLFDISAADPAEAIDGLVSLAPVLAELHRWPTEGAEVPSATPPLPELDPVHVSAWVDGTQPSRHLLRSLQRRERLCQSLRRACARVGPQGLIHGDLKLDNVLSSPAGPIVIDWELGGHGPLAWDLGSVLGSILAIWIDGADLDQPAPDHWFENAVIPYPEACSAVRRFVSEYRARVTGPMMPTLSILVDYLASWLVARSWVESSLIPQVNPRHLLRLIIAEGIVRSPQALLPEFAG